MPRRKDGALMRRHVLAVALSASFLVAAPASADDDAAPRKPDAAQLAKAAEQFDAGVGAFKHKDYEGAAAHFEEADAAVPGAQALRQAIRARAEAGQGARAATLAVQALERYPGDGATAKLARDTIDKFAPILHKVRVVCAAPCVLSVGDTPVPGAAGKRWVIYLDPGSATLSASFAGVAVPAQDVSVSAKAGGEGEAHFEPPPKKVAPPPPPPPPPPIAAPSKGELPPEEPKPEEPKPAHKGISPVFFGIGAAATVALGATTIWSGIDTNTNPGPAAVKAACEGKGTSCPLYQEGLGKQTRTNALIGATAGTGAVTILLAIFTNWHGSAKEPVAEPIHDGAASGLKLWASAEPTAIVIDRGAVLGAAGVF
jgi:hypothetical protein